MNNFFNQPIQNTVNVNGMTFTAQDIAKVISFGPKTIQWDGANTWIAPSAAAGLLASFCTKEGSEEHKTLQSELVAKVSYGETHDKVFAAVMFDAINIAQGWGALRLHTCLKNKSDEEREINLDKLEDTLGFSLGDEVRGRLSRVSVKKDGSEWMFKGALGTVWRENATQGILYEIADAVNLVEFVTEKALFHVKRGVTCFEEIAEESSFINIERMSQDDIEAVKKAIEESGVEPEDYMAYFSNRYDECRLSPANVAEDYWAFSYEVKTFPTRAEAVEFVKQFNLNYRPQRRRTELEMQILEAQDKLEDLKNELEKLQ